MKSDCKWKRSKLTDQSTGGPNCFPASLCDVLLSLRLTYPVIKFTYAYVQRSLGRWIQTWSCDSPPIMQQLHTKSEFIFSWPASGIFGTRYSSPILTHAIQGLQVPYKWVRGATGWNHQPSPLQTPSCAIPAQGLHFGAQGSCAEAAWHLSCQGLVGTVTSSPKLAPVRTPLPPGPSSPFQLMPGPQSCPQLHHICARAKVVPCWAWLIDWFSMSDHALPSLTIPGLSLNPAASPGSSQRVQSLQDCACGWGHRLCWGPPSPQPGPSRGPILVPLPLDIHMVTPF